MSKQIKGTELSIQDQKRVLANYAHRFTKEHVPAWAVTEPRNKVQFASDRDWLENTFFKVNKNGKLNERACCESHPTWPDNPELRLITLNELVQVSNSYTVILPNGTLVFVQHGQYYDLFGIQPPNTERIQLSDDELVWYLYGRQTKAQVVAALEVLLNEGETWEPWHVTTAIEEAA